MRQICGLLRVSPSTAPVGNNGPIARLRSKIALLEPTLRLREGTVSMGDTRTSALLFLVSPALSVRSVQPIAYGNILAGA